MEEWIPVRYAVLCMDIVLKEIEVSEDISIECFPNKTRIKPGKDGQLIKLPYGLHPMTGERSFFIGNDGNLQLNLDYFMDAEMEYKKQRRSIDRNIEKVEYELAGIFDERGIEEMEIDMGLLMRRRKENGYEWVIGI